MTGIMLHEDLTAAIKVQRDSIVSKTVHADEQIKVVLMALDAGQELSEHTAAMPAVIHLLEGQADVTLGEQVHSFSQGAWVHMPAHLRHAVRAVAPTILLLTLIKTGKTS